ncbi:hypothetical protein KIW84_034905 [Lathyrus oleraceus]|uniref:Uncharacterized protein n=1 Tax=Pisum sativum TaxID=3888 RepID=A0A9D5B5W1_PEA|nr:hypothetical protein KIW84_034905 [Pisum sativum]
MNLYLLLEFDIEATLDVLRCALMEDKISNSSSSSLDSADKAIDEETKENNSVTETENILVQNTVDALIQITDMNVAPSDTTSSVGDEGLTKEWPLNGKGCLFVFIAYYVARQRAKVSKDMLCRILEYLTLDNRFLANVCGLIHSIRYEYVAALGSYMKDVDEPVHAFPFNNKAFSQLIGKTCIDVQKKVIPSLLLGESEFAHGLQTDLHQAATFPKPI